MLFFITLYQLNMAKISICSWDDIVKFINLRIAAVFSLVVTLLLFVNRDVYLSLRANAPGMKPTALICSIMYHNIHIY